MDILTGKVLRVISGPKQYVRRITTTIENWVDGVLQDQDKKQRDPSIIVWWEILAEVEEEWLPAKQEKIIKCATAADADKVVPGYTYNV